MSKNSFSKLVGRLVNEALKETIDGVLIESESDERARMQRAIRARYNEAEEDEAEKSKKAIDADKIVPGASKERDDADSTAIADEERASDKPPEIKIPDEEQLMAPTYDFAKEQINSFRAGASLNNETVDSNFRKYFEALPDAEKRSVIIYSTALAQIARGMMPAEEVLTASKAGLSQDSKGRTGSEKEPEEQQVSMTVSKASDAEDDSAMPIIVGESATVRKLIQRAGRK